MLLEIDKARVIVTSTTTVLRLNKQAGMFTSGNIDVTDPESIKQYGRGKSLEIAPCLITTGLFGNVGKIVDTYFVHISGIVTASESSKLPPGLLVQFVIYGLEAEVIEAYQREAEIAHDLGQKVSPKIMKMVFNRTVTVAKGTIKPPTISFHDPDKNSSDLALAAFKLYDLHPELMVNPTDDFPGLRLDRAVPPALPSA